MADTINTFVSGTKVNLVSGGPCMTVNGPTNDLGFVNCVWWEINDRNEYLSGPHQFEFHVDALEEDDEED